MVFTAAAAGSLVLVVLDRAIGRPGGDVFITALNALAAFVLWRKFPDNRGHDEGLNAAGPTWREGPT